MRSPEDLIEVEVVLSSVISLDRERIIEDPVWASIADNVDLNDPREREQALFMYLGSYITRCQMFGGSIFMPSTNGPSDIKLIEMEDVTNGNSNSSGSNKRDNSTTGN